jgi:hypothetical protein
MTLPDLLLTLAVHHPGTSKHPTKQSDSMAMAVSYPCGRDVHTAAPIARRYRHIVSTVGRLFHLMTLPDLLLTLAVHHLGTSSHPTKQSNSTAIAVSYPVDAMFTPRLKPRHQ